MSVVLPWCRAEAAIPALDGDSASVDIAQGDWIQRDDDGRVRRVVGPGDDPEILCAFSLDAEGHALESMMIDWSIDEEVAPWIRLAVEHMPIERGQR